MDGSRFDELTRALGARPSRRAVTKGVVGALGVAGLKLAHATDAGAVPVCTLTCPGDQVIDLAPGVCSYPASSLTFASHQGCGQVKCVPESNATFERGETTVVCSQTDGPESCSFLVTIRDLTAPSITCPANIEIAAAEGTCAATATFDLPTSVDDCSSAYVSCDWDSGASFPVGTTTVTCTSYDDDMNESSCTFTVTVDDGTAPSITCPANITVSNDDGICGAVVMFDDPMAEDDCSDVSVSCDWPSGSTFPVGTTTVTCTATDTPGNYSTCTFTVTVEDTELPTIICPANIHASSDAGVCGAMVEFGFSENDNCGTLSVSCVDSHDVAWASGDSFPVGVTHLTCDISDGVNDPVECHFNIHVDDTEAPMITCPADIVVSVPEGKTSADVDLVDATATDNCGDVTVVCDEMPVGGFPLGKTDVTCMATDGAGNTAECTYHVKVVPYQTNPVTIHKAVCPADKADDLYGNCHGNLKGGYHFAVTDIYEEMDVVTGSNGMVTAIVGVGEVNITEAAGDRADNIGIYVYCSTNNNSKILFDGRADGGSVTIDVAHGNEVICDWYNITKAGNVTPTPSPVPTKPADQLPNTGAAPTNSGGFSGLLTSAALVSGAAALISRKLLKNQPSTND